KPAVKAQSDRAANADRPDRRAPLARPARRVTPARRRPFAWSLVRIAFAAETTKSWLGLFVRGVRPTERSGGRPARQRPGYVYGGDLGHRVATSSTFQQKSFNTPPQRIVKLFSPLEHPALNTSIFSLARNSV